MDFTGVFISVWFRVILIFFREIACEFKTYEVSSRRIFNTIKIRVLLTKRFTYCENDGPFTPCHSKVLARLLFLIEEVEITIRVEHHSLLRDQLDGYVSLLRFVNEIVEDLDHIVVEVFGLGDVELQ